MIRVGFVLFHRAEDWHGGINYFTNLMSALDLIPKKKVQPVIFVRTGMRSTAQEWFLEQEVVEAKWLTSAADNLRTRLLEPSRTWLGRKAWMRVFRRYRIDVLSHTSFLGDSPEIPMVGWIYDYQHRHLPNLFSKDDSSSRDREFAAICRNCSQVIVSSGAAFNDLKQFQPECEPRARILRFITNITRVAATPKRELESKYGFSGHYYCLPNQFWKHKNHAVVIDALKLLQDRQQQVLFICSGSTRDYRQPDYYEQLMSRVHDYGLRGFRSLGMIPYADVLGLMRDAVAVVNPSLFEGWSTSVEEAKALGKLVLLSDIPVHREQNPDRSVYFDPHDPAALADALVSVRDKYDPEVELGCTRTAAEQLPFRLRQFAEDYERIVLEATSANTVLKHT